MPSRSFPPWGLDPGLDSKVFHPKRLVIRWLRGRIPRLIQDGIINCL